MQSTIGICDVVIKNTIEGVTLFQHSSKSCWVCHIESFSNELKKEIQARLSSICHGERKADPPSKIYSYKETLKEFCRRYETKSDKIKKGMIGELLSHIIILKEFRKFRPASPFFNMEEKSVKKGFDLMLFETNSERIWISEVKSGEAGTIKSDVKNSSLLTNAKNDLKTRLNEQELSIWHNAINGAFIALKDGKVKEQINNILKSIAEEGSDGRFSSRDKDVILISVLFNSLNDKISLDKVVTKRQEIAEENLFRNVITFSIQKGTYKKIASFLKAESMG